MLKRSIVSTSNVLEKGRIKYRNLIREYEAKTAKMAKLTSELNELQKKLNETNDCTVSSAERAKQMRSMMQYEEKQAKLLEQEIERMHKTLYRVQQTVFELRNFAQAQEKEITGCHTAMSLLRKHSKDMYNELQRQKEIVYELDFQMTGMERRLCRLEGEFKEENRENVEEKIRHLEKVLAQNNETKSLLINQFNRTEDEMRRLTSNLTSDNEYLENLENKLQDQSILFEGGRKQMVTAKLRSQQRQVEENILKLKVNQFEKAMSKEENCIYNLHRYRLELETAMRERQIEINSNKDILQVRRRNLDEERGRLKNDIAGRHLKIEHLQKRYHVFLMSLGSDEDGQPVSVTTIKIKNAQEKYMLQQQGDELDAKVNTAEKEIVAMENTLQVVNLSNSTYKQSLSFVEESSQELQDLADLEHEMAETHALVGKNKRSYIAKQKQLRELGANLEEALRIRKEVKEILIVSQNELDDFQRANQEKIVKIDRTNKHIKKALRALVIADKERYQKNLLIRQLQDANKTGLLQIKEIAVRYQETTPLINRYMIQHNLKLPVKPILTPSTSSESLISLESLGSVRTVISPTMARLTVSFPQEVPPKLKLKRC